MNRALTTLSLALTLGASLIGASMSPALADGDPYYSNGINPYGVRTPVPAPIPVPVEEADWYFRGDFAAGFGGNPSVTTTGTPYGLGTVGLQDAWLYDSFLPSFMGGVGVGYVWAPHLRTDFTVDIQSIMSATFSSGPQANAVLIDDKTKFISTILLANAYYDIRTGTPWTPYVGVGVGFAVNQLTRNADWTDSTGSYSADTRTTQVKFAGAAMAGVSYDFSSFFAIDVNYRYMYIGGTDVSMGIGGFPSSVGFDGLNEHQIRAGFRFYVN
ncbi:MAG: outer membrane beta-barrel protein [Hyphomicrobium sp.]|uniref:outer membrane protein n=1 Tax=Hyphomicrobium sp. TaxID=82 RepID=UPI00132A2F10|nr:outer membrane beta-barrel protein [Hyphomicrobium sp.]KAB2940057.1 MAG: porin family protein [Hyphomicrobium sp.]MBZ0209574.1 outer membrane beta-barrel protein [Hyphomicrobium sp.]